MRIRMKTIMAGPNLSARPGQVLRVPEDLPKSQAYDLCEGGYAEQVADREFEAAVMPAVEVAADITIPDGWRKLPAGALKALAASLGTEAKNKAQAKAAIESAGG